MRAAHMFYGPPPLLGVIGGEGLGEFREQVKILSRGASGDGLSIHPMPVAYDGASKYCPTLEPDCYRGVIAICKSRSRGALSSISVRFPAFSNSTRDMIN
jgi:hypothetical protein